MRPYATELLEERFPAASVGEAVEYCVLIPANASGTERLPLVLHLHAAMSSSASLEVARPLYDELIADGVLPPSVVACVSTPTSGGFYIDNGGKRWESLVAAEFPAHLANRFGPFDATALIGASMGGYGALKIAFADPGRYAAVAAISPAVFPGENPEAVPDRNTPSILGDLHEAMFQGTGDPAKYTANSVQGRARANAAEMRSARLPVLIDCGGADEFLLHEGAEALHELLVELRVPHEFRLVPGAGHVGPQAERRTRDAIAFVGHALTRR